jgi:integrase
MSAYSYHRTDTANGSIQIKWKDVDRGQWQSTSFAVTDARRAAEFRAAVEAAGDRWPRGWDIEACAWAHEVRSVVTVDEVAAQWFEHMRGRVLKGRVRSATVDRYAEMYDNRIRPALGQLEFSDVTLADIEAWSDELLRDLSGKTVRDYFSCILNPILEYGVARMELRPQNPARGYEKPRRGRSKRDLRFFSRAEWRVFRACLAPDVHDLVDTLLGTGMRVAEAMALQAGDIEPNPEGGVRVHIRRAWAERGSAEKHLPRLPGENGSWLLKCPKTGEGRTVIVQGGLSRRLRELADELPPDAWLFTTREGNPWRQSDFLTDRWHPARRTAETLGYAATRRPSDLRHTFVVWALDRKIPLVTISAWLGHTSIATTYDQYGGVLNVENSGVAGALAEAMDVADVAVAALPTPEEIAARKVRPRRRGENRSRAYRQPQDEEQGP